MLSAADPSPAAAPAAAASQTLSAADPAAAAAPPPIYVYVRPPPTPQWNLDARGKLYLVAGLLLAVFMKLTVDRAFLSWADAEEATRWRAMERSTMALLSPGRGILAADESLGTIGKRFEQVGLPNDNQTRYAWRHVILTTPLLEQYISGVILSEETLRQRWSDGGGIEHMPLPHACIDGNHAGADGPGPKAEQVACDGDGPGQGGRQQQQQQTLAQALTSRGIHVGIKVDLGTRAFDPEAGAGVNEVWTRGMEGLLFRCKEYAELGATFAKWRAVFHVGPQPGSGHQAAGAHRNDTRQEQELGNGTEPALGDASTPLQLPSPAALRRNARDLANFAAAAQRAGLVPIVEPEVLVSEGAHDVAASAAATRRVLSAVAAALAKHRAVNPRLLIVKPNMILPSSGSGGGGGGGEAGAGAAAPHRLPEPIGPAPAAADPAVVAAETVAALQELQEALPDLPGVAFLSGGQSPELAVQHLHAINVLWAQVWEQQQQQQEQRQVPQKRGGRQQSGLGTTHKRLVVTFSFGRALLQTALELWATGLRDMRKHVKVEDESGAGLSDWECGNGGVGGARGEASSSVQGPAKRMPGGGPAGAASCPSASGGLVLGGPEAAEKLLVLQQQVQAELLRWCAANSRAVQGLPPFEQAREEA